MKIGSIDLDEIYNGSNEISSVYIGNNEIFVSRVKKLVDIEGEPTALWEDGSSLFVATRIDYSQNKCYVNLYQFSLYKGRLSYTTMVLTHAAIQNGSITNNASSKGTEYIRIMRRLYRNQYFGIVGSATSSIIWDLNSSSIYKSTYFNSNAYVNGACIDESGGIVLSYVDSSGNTACYLAVYWYGQETKKAVQVSTSYLYGHIFYKGESGTATQYYALNNWGNNYCILSAVYGGSAVINISKGSDIAIANTITTEQNAEAFMDGTPICFGPNDDARYQLTKINLSNNSVSNLKLSGGFVRTPGNDKDSYIRIGWNNTIKKIQKSDLSIVTDVDTSKVCSNVYMVSQDPYADAVYAIGYNEANSYFLFYCRTK